MRTILFKISDNNNGRTIRSLLKNELELSSGLIARLKRIKNGITLNGNPVHTDVRVNQGDEICVIIGASNKGTGSLPYEILFEDEDILIINKPAGAAVHGSRYDDTVDSIENCVNRYYGNTEMFHPVSRLDKGTTGIMTIAKNGYMHDLLIKRLHSEEFKRVYLGIVKGQLGEKQGVIRLPIGRVDGSAIKRMVRDDGADAITHYSVVLEKEEHSLVRFRLETGKTHQIRVHMAAIGHPLIGDWLYGEENHDLILRPSLHSSELEFLHPLMKKRIKIKCELPEDMKRLLK